MDLYELVIYENSCRHLLSPVIWLYRYTLPDTESKYSTQGDLTVEIAVAAAAALRRIPALRDEDEDMENADDVVDEAVDGRLLSL